MAKLEWRTMDLLTQGVLGACLAQSGSRQPETRMATWLGFLAGIAADADIFITSANDPLLNIEYHRHFTHSIFFIPIGAFLVSILLWPLVRCSLTFKRVFWFCLLGFSLSGFIDACTSYGTRLFWPVIPDRLAFNLISIVDPILTGTLIVGLIWAWRKRSARSAQVGLLFGGLYLLLGLYQHDRAMTAAATLAEQRGHVAGRLLVKPTLGNLLLWRSVYLHDARLFVDGIRVGFAQEVQVYSGASVDLFERSRDLPDVPVGAVLEQDIRRFVDFSDQYVATSPLDEMNQRALADIRFASLPTSLAPLWVLRFDPNQPDQHGEFVSTREFSSESRKRFIQMLRGQP